MQIQANDSFSTGLQVCTEVLLYLASRMHQLAEGETLEFVSTDPNAADQIIPWAEMRGFDLLETTRIDETQTRYLIRR
jgi:TusA-related sulfurtransferase